MMRTKLRYAALVLALMIPVNGNGVNIPLTVDPNTGNVVPTTVNGHPVNVGGGGSGLSGGTSGHVVTASGATTIADSGTALTSLAVLAGGNAFTGHSTLTLTNTTADLGEPTGDGFDVTLNYKGHSATAAAYQGSAIHARSNVLSNGGTAPVGTVHGVSSHVTVTNSGSSTNEFTPLFLDLSGNAQGRYWLLDASVFGPVSTQATLLAGPTFFIGNYNASQIPAQSIGLTVVTRPGGAGGGDAAVDRTNRVTYPIDVGIAISGRSGDPGLDPVDFATEGFTTALAIGGDVIGGWSDDYGSKIGTGIDISSYDNYGLYIHDRSAGQTGPAIAVGSGAGSVGIGLLAPSAELHVLSATEQVRIGYDTSNYYKTTVGSTGGVTFDAVGSGAGFTFADAVTLPAGTVTDAMASLLVKPAVAVVATSNLTLSGEQTIDGQLTSGSLVLATAQTTGSQNGPWVSASGSWARPTWYANGSTTQAPQFLTTFVRLGTTYQGSTWRMTTAAVTIGTTSTTWVQTPTNLNSVIGTLAVANGGTGITSFGTGVATALAANTLANGGLLKEGSAIGATTPAAGTFTTLTAGSTTSLLLGTAGSAVGNIGFRNATSGTITLAPPTGALGTVTATLPLGGTLATLAGSETFTNKTIDKASNTLTGVAGSGANSDITSITGLTGATTNTQNALGAATADGTVLKNTTAATSSVQQWSPAVHYTAHGWHSNGTPADKTYDLRAYLSTVSTGDPGALGGAGGVFIWDGQFNGGGYTTLASLDYNGLFTASSITASTNLIGATFFLGSSSGTKFQNDSAGAIRVLNATNNALATVGFARLILNKTSNYSVSVNDSMNILTNSGSSGEVDFTLPASPTAGLEYTFYVAATQTLKVIANTGQTIRIAGSVSASAGNITNGTIGGSVTINAVTTTSWIATAAPNGTWTVN